MIANVFALISLTLAFRGSYLQKKATDEKQMQNAKLIVLYSIISIIAAFTLRLYDV